MIKRVARMIKHPEWCNVDTPCNGCLKIPKHKYVGPIDCADCQVCGYCIDMPCHEVEQ
jgi:hypothetical protein